MSPSRQPNERRRRVMYATRQMDAAPRNASTRDREEQMRQARRPGEKYGVRVRQTLRGRVFAIVPVRRRAMACLATGILLIAAALCVAHGYAVFSPAIADNAELARPLRVDRQDGFGAWYSTVLLLISAWATYLIYCLRRYRVDDYVGHYRIWRPLIAALILSSLESVVGLVSWGGALIDVIVGDRIAMAGADWLRMLIAFGGAALCMRLLVEVRASRLALGFMVAAWIVLALRVMVRWNIIGVQTPTMWMVATTAPLIGRSFLAISLFAFLRLVYREVMRIEDQAIMEQFSSMQLPSLSLPQLPMWLRRDEEAIAAREEARHQRQLARRRATEEKTQEKKEKQKARQAAAEKLAEEKATA
ncbi:MAG: hypothetical protein AAFP90_06060, partial [Planctomycetota bacterium]